MGAHTRRVTGFRPRRCSSVAKTSIFLPGCLAASSATASASLFLNAAASSGEADLGFFGRSVWIDQPIAFNASQPRCGATDLRPIVAMYRCGGANRREPRVLRHYSGQAIVRPIARRKLLMPILAKQCDRGPKARSPGNAVTWWRRDISLFQLLHARMLTDCRHVSPPTHGD
jgi:hypothetical protein